jgi:MFS family permease
MSDISTSAPQAAIISHNEPRDRLGMPALVAATTISNIGNGITALAIPWFVLVTTGSAARTGIAGALTLLAYVVSGILGGALVDRLGYKRASIFADLLSGITVALIPTLYLLDVLAFWHILVLIFLGAIFDSPGHAARTALVPVLARRAGMPLERANAAMQIGGQSSQTLLGPLSAGLLIGLLGAANVLFVDAATFAVSIIIVGLLVRVSATSGGVAGAGGHVVKTSYVTEVLEGMRFVTRDAFLRVIIPVSILYNFLFAPVFAVTIPVFVKESMGGAGTLGLLITGFGIGTAVSTLAYGAIGHRLSRLHVLYGGVILIAIGCWILALAPGFLVALLGLIVVGVAIGPTNTLGSVLIQARVPEGMLGRVSALMFAFSTLAAPLGVFIIGFLIDATGYRVALVSMAVGATIATTWALAIPELRRLRGELESAGRISASAGG